MKKLLLLGALLTSMNASAVESDWRFHVDTDEITDEKSYYVYKSFEGAISTDYIFSISCDKKGLGIAIKRKSFEVFRESSALFRVDKEQPYEVGGNFYKNSWFAKDEGAIKRAVLDLKRGRRLIVRLKGRNTVTKSINLSGFTRAYSKLEAKCGK